MTGLQPPATPVFNAGYDPLVADFTSWVTNPFTFLATRPFARLQQTSFQSISSSTPTVVHYDATPLEDPYGGWNPSTFQWLCPCSGWYEVTVINVLSAGSGNMTVESRVWLSGSGFAEIGGNNTPASISGVSGGSGGSCLVGPCVGGQDYIQGVINTSAAVTTSGVLGRNSTMEIAWVSE